MKKIIKFTLYRSYDILIGVFLIYLIIYSWGELDRISSAYSYLLVVLLGMIIGFGLCGKINQLIYRNKIMSNKQQQKPQQQQPQTQRQKHGSQNLWEGFKNWISN